MTPQEFKAWFEGFTEAFDRIPTKAQWARVKERVAEIDGKPVTEKVFVDRYWPTIYPYYNYPTRYYPIYPSPSWTTYCGSGSGIGSGGTYSVDNISTITLPASPFNATSAMYSLGKSEAQGLV